MADNASEPTEPAYGPAMMALTPKQRKFVLAMASMPLDSAADWARAAGYSDKAEGCKVRASELWADEKVRAAILELAREHLGTIGPLLASRLLVKIACDSEHPRQLQAVTAIANRVGLPEIERVEINHTHTLSGEALIERVTSLATKLGLDPAKLIGVAVPKVPEPLMIEAEAAEVVEDPPAV